MTDYADVPTVNALHGECDRVEAALSMLNAGGTMVQFTVGPAPVAPGEMPTGEMPIAIVAPAGTVQQATLDNLTAWLTQRQSDLVAQMATLGVTGMTAG